jgi:hypothetical protein
MTKRLESRQQQGLAAATPSRRALRETLFEGCRRYDRERHLPRVIPVGPDEVADLSPEGRHAILRKLARALRAERSRGRAGHWTYDLNRHIALRQAFAAERRAIAPG